MRTRGESEKNKRRSEKITSLELKLDLLLALVPALFLELKQILPLVLVFGMNLKQVVLIVPVLTYV